MIENLIKCIISIPLIAALLFSSLLLRRLWITQIDVSQTIRLWFSEQLSLSDWVAVRNKNAIYQDSKLVGLVELPPVFKENKVIFPRVRYVSAINEERPIEFKRFECNKIIVNGTVRVEEMGDASWYENLQCEIVGK